MLSLAVRSRNAAPKQSSAEASERCARVSLLTACLRAALAALPPTHPPLDLAGRPGALRPHVDPAPVHHVLLVERPGLALHRTYSPHTSQLRQRVVMWPLRRQ